MNPKNLELDHVGVVVKSIEESREIYCNLLGFIVDSEVINVTSQKILCQYLIHTCTNIRVQLIEPIGENSPSYGALLKGGGPNHLCFSVDDLDHKLQEAKDAKCLIVTPPFRGEGVDNRRAAFIYSPKLGLTELVEAKREF